MHLESYPYTKRSTPVVYDFSFESTGPNGRIPKRVEYELTLIDGKSYLNLALGDWIKGIEYLDHLAISNNNDSYKIMSTVVATLIEVLQRHPDMFVYAEGSTRARTRLYQIGINSNLNDESRINVFGLKNGVWEPFRKSINYKAFSAQLK
jgi:hypothetical protein